MEKSWDVLPHRHIYGCGRRAYWKLPSGLRQASQLPFVISAGRRATLRNFPKHALAEATMDAIRAVGIDTRFILRTDSGRLGLYFLETGANQRPSNVIYDRADSAIATTAADQYDWNAICPFFTRYYLIKHLKGFIYPKFQLVEKCPGGR